MTKDNWLQMFDETKENFRWFFFDYGFEERWNQLLAARTEGDTVKMYSIMNDVWFLLPDSEFNIRRNPAGWQDFLNLLEEDAI